jgi:hypothetical protein
MKIEIEAQSSVHLEFRTKPSKKTIIPERICFSNVMHKRLIII